MPASFPARTGVFRLSRSGFERERSSPPAHARHSPAIAAVRRKRAELHAREALSICPVLKFDREEVSPRTRRFLGMRRLLLALLSPRTRRSPPWNGMKKTPCFRLAVCASFVCGLFGFCKFNALNLIFVCFDAANPGKGSTIFRIIIRENSQRFLSLVRAIFTFPSVLNASCSVIMHSPWLCRHDMRTGSGIMHEEFTAFPMRKAFFAQTHLQAASAHSPPHARHFQGYGHIYRSLFMKRASMGAFFQGRTPTRLCFAPPPAGWNGQPFSVEGFASVRTAALPRFCE